MSCNIVTKEKKNEKCAISSKSYLFVYICIFVSLKSYLFVYLFPVLTSYLNAFSRMWDSKLCCL